MLHVLRRINAADLYCLRLLSRHALSNRLMIYWWSRIGQTNDTWIFDFAESNLHSTFCKWISRACTKSRESDLRFVAAHCNHRTDTVDERMHMEFNSYIFDAHALGGRRKQWICIICTVWPQPIRHAEIQRLAVFCDYSDAGLCNAYLVCWRWLLHTT